MKKSDNRRHILSLSGGKDSAALAVYLKDKIPNLEYVFLDTGKELPETYDFLNRMRAVLGIEITTLKSKRDFDWWLRVFNGCLPSPQNRWCTKLLKIIPYENYIGEDRVISYIGLRSDEDRTGYFSNKPNIIPMYPFIEDNLTKKDIIEILENSGLGLPKYYKWRGRSGCYFCFFQKRSEWIGLYDYHNNPPECLFDKACEYETNHSDGRQYTWIQGEPLRQLIRRRETILHDSYTKAKKTESRSNRLSDRLKSVQFSLGNESVLRKSFSGESDSTQSSEEDKPCLICTI